MADFDGITLARAAYGRHEGGPEAGAQPRPGDLAGRRRDLWTDLGFSTLANSIRGVYEACGWTHEAGAATGRSVAIASASHGEGRSSISWALAIATAHDHAGDVLLLECDMLHPSFRQDLGLRDGPGLSDLLAEDSDLPNSLPAILCPTRMLNLSVLPAGRQLKNPARLLRSPRMLSLLAQLQRRFAFMIIDLPPVLVSSESAGLARLVDGVVLVARAGATDERAAHQTVQMLAGATIHGVVLNRWRTATPRLLRRLVAS